MREQDQSMAKKIALMLAIVLIASIFILLIKPSYGSVTDNYWVQKAPMPTARGGLGVIAIDGLIYAIGGAKGLGAYPADGYVQSVPYPFSGYASANFVGTNEVYDTSTNTWVSKASMPTGRDYFAIAAYQGKIYCIGGHVSDYQEPAADYLWGPNMTSVNEVYTIATNSWETKAPMPGASMNLQASVVNGEILVRGVAYKGNGLSYLYDPATDKWSTSSAIPFSSWYQDEGAHNSIQININNKTMVTGVGDGAAVKTSGINAPISAYVIGSAVNEVYNPSNDSWTKGAAMPTQRSDFGLTVSDDLLYAVGGFKGVSSTAANEQYIPFGYTVQNPSASPSPTPTTPEFSWVVIVPLLLSIFLIAIVLRHRKTAT